MPKASKTRNLHLKGIQQHHYYSIKLLNILDITHVLIGWLPCLHQRTVLRTRKICSKICAKSAPKLSASGQGVDWLADQIWSKNAWKIKATAYFVNLRLSYSLVSAPNFVTNLVLWRHQLVHTHVISVDQIKQIFFTFTPTFESFSRQQAGRKWRREKVY